MLVVSSRFVGVRLAQVVARQARRRLCFVSRSRRFFGLGAAAGRGTASLVTLNAGYLPQHAYSFVPYPVHKSMQVQNQSK